MQKFNPKDMGKKFIRFSNKGKGEYKFKDK